MIDRADIVRDFVTHASEVHSGGDAALAALSALEQELDALAEVAADSNEREKLLEAELARLIEMHERIANLDWPADDFHLARAISRAAIAPKEEAWGSLDKLTGSTALGKEPTA